MIQTLIRICYQLEKSEISFEIENDELETTSNPLNAHRHATDKSLVAENKNLLKIFLLLYFINQASLIAWLPLLREILGNMCIVIVS